LQLNRKESNLSEGKATWCVRMAVGRERGLGTEECLAGCKEDGLIPKVREQFHSWQGKGLSSYFWPIWRRKNKNSAS